MNYIDTMRLALEALLNSNPCRRPGDDDFCERGWKEHRAAEAALRLAIEEVEQQESDANEGPINEGWQLSVSDGHSGRGVYAYMAEYPEEGAVFLMPIEQAEKQEPVGVVATDTSKTHLYYGAQYLGQKPESKTVLLLKDLPLGTPLYAAPPQRQPLTDEEIDRIGRKMLGAGYGGNTDRDFARAIERAHGITGDKQ